MKRNDWTCRPYRYFVENHLRIAICRMRDREMVNMLRCFHLNTCSPESLRQTMFVASGCWICSVCWRRCYCLVVFKWRNGKGQKQSCKILWHWGMLRDVKKLYCFLFYITYQGLSDTHKTLNYTKSVALEATIPHVQGRAERCSFCEKVWRKKFNLKEHNKISIYSKSVFARQEPPSFHGFSVHCFKSI